MTRSNEIRQRGKEALRSIPGIVALYEFGSHANGTADEWSDIDFQLFSEDVDISVSGRCAPLLAIAPVMIEWTIVRTENAWASTVLFADTSPLCHLDIGISTAGSFVHDSMLSESRLHWTQKARYQSTGMEPAWFAPEPGGAEHAMLGDILGALRYVKARRRGQDLLCWKFFSALANRMLEAAYQVRVHRDRGFGKPLTSHEHMQLRKALSRAETDDLASMIVTSDGASMDRNMVQLGHALVKLIDEREEISSTCRTAVMMLLTWIERALLDQEFNDALS